MVLRARHGSASYIISLKPHSLAVSRDETHVVAWDLGGRLYSVYQDEVAWRRGLSGHVLEKRGSGASRQRRLLDAGDAASVTDAAARFAQETLDAMASATWVWTSAIDGMVAQLVSAYLLLSSRFDTAAAMLDARRFASVYRPIGILPPDQYLSLVVQATEGCSFNTCTFCDLYHDGYRVKSPEEFRDHVADVRAYLGESASLRSRGIFLGSANALAIPMPTLVPVFEILVDDLDGIRRGVFAFVDAFTGGLKDSADYRLLSTLGLRRIYLGLESGHDPLLDFARKPGSAAAAVETALAAKRGGVQVGVIVMTGLGGDRFDDGHVRDSIRVLDRMRLGEGDLIYFSDLVEVPGTAYPQLAQRADIRPLSAERKRAQQQAIRAGLTFDGIGPQFATYDIREFVY